MGINEFCLVLKIWKVLIKVMKIPRGREDPKNCFQNKLVFPIASSTTNTRKDSSTDTSNSLTHLIKMAESEKISSFSFLLISP